MNQGILPFTFPPRFDAALFHVAPCNETAQRMVLSWPSWGAHALVLTGEEGSGKSHLASLWAEQTHARVLAGANLSEQELARAAEPHLIEDIEHVREERLLLHWLNESKAAHAPLLMTARSLPFRLPDLTSRLSALPHAEIGAPDDALLALVLRKQFADRQIQVEEEVLHYLLQRGTRSFSALRQLVERLDTTALQAKRTLTIPFVRAHLES